MSEPVSRPTGDLRIMMESPQRTPPVTDRAAPAQSQQAPPDWPRWQKALSVEAETGFGNLMGRQSRFNAFLASCFADPAEGLTDHDRDRWQSLADRFRDYDALTASNRQYLEARRVFT